MPSKAEIREFLKYLVTDQIDEIQQSIKSILYIIFKFKSWMFIWLGICVYGVIIRNYNLILWSLIASILFLIIYEWADGEWRHKHRDELRQKIKIKYKANK